MLDRFADPDPTGDLLARALDVAYRLAGLLDEIDAATNADAKSGEEVDVGAAEADELVGLLGALDDCLRERRWSS